jgi:hypothetical protein
MSTPVRGAEGPLGYAPRWALTAESVRADTALDAKRRTPTPVQESLQDFRPPLAVMSLRETVSRVYHLSPVTSPRFLGGLLPQARVRINAKLLGGTATGRVHQSSYLAVGGLYSDAKPSTASSNALSRLSILVLQRSQERPRFLARR